MRVRLGIALSVLACLWAPPASSQTEPSATTLTGQVVDPGLYLRGGAPGSAEQTYEAVDGGQSLALLAENGVLYILLAERPGEDPNELVYDYVNKRVTLVGRVYERGGAKGIVAQSVDSLEPGAEEEETLEDAIDEEPVDTGETEE